MKAISKTMLGAGAAAVAALSFAAPAEAQYRDRYRDRGGIDAGDIVTGVAILGGIAAITSALTRDGSRYGYGYGYGDRYRTHYNYAVQSCAREAQRMGRGQVQILDVDRAGNDRYRVRGIVQSGYGGGYGGYDRYDRYDRGGRDDFTCVARGNGRITDFRL
ncbi:MAG TPA: hypothetical protein VE053_03785 [Allosphingosinicella sp.]|nr:hypothetical protein [Allosphingosinicella sp.]